MNYLFALIFCLCICIGCSNKPNPDAARQDTDSKVEEGGTLDNADRDKAEAYFVSLGKVQSDEEERKLLTEFAKWLEENEYKIRVERRNEKYVLSCPYFPPVTPWTSHAFFNEENLELLPLHDDDG